MWTVWVDPPVQQSLKTLPGHIRQRVRQAIRELVNEPRPHDAKQLNITDMRAEVWRLRIDQWRVIYTIEPDLRVVTIWAVRKRPPYNYDDLSTLLTALRN